MRRIGYYNFLKSNGAKDRCVLMGLNLRTCKEGQIKKRIQTDEKNKKDKSAPLLYKNRQTRVDRIPISAARGYVQPVFYPALSLSVFE